MDINTAKSIFRGLVSRAYHSAISSSRYKGSSQLLFHLIASLGVTILAFRNTKNSEGMFSGSHFLSPVFTLFPVECYTLI